MKRAEKSKDGLGTWFRDWGYWEDSAKRVTAVRKYAGKYCVRIAVGETDRLSEIIKNNSAASGLLNDTDKGYVVALNGKKILFYREFTEYDAASMDYRAAQAMFANRQAKQPLENIWVCRINFGQVEVFNEKYRQGLVKLFGANKVLPR